jgi:hypothetical protein
LIFSRGELLEATTTVKDPEDFWTRWNDFVRGFDSNAFHLGGPVEYYMGVSRSEGWTPQLITMTVDGRLVGIAAMKTKGILGARIATFLKAFGSDFVVDPRYREAFVSNTLRFLLKGLRCQFLDLTFPSESPNLDLLKKICMSLRLRLDASPLDEYYREHSVLQVVGTWDEFRNMRGGNFVRHYGKIERKLTNAGKWRIERLAIDGPDPVDRINAVERNSWKNAWRRERGEEADSGLESFFGYWKSKSSDRWSLPRLWLLYLNDEPISFVIALQLNGVALLCKTSYDDRYMELYPGDYIQNAVIRDLFNSREVSKIDFLTALAYHRRWTSLRLTRERVTISQSVPLLSPLITTVGRNRYIRTAYHAVQH